VNRPPKLVLIDGNSLLYRAFFALPPLTNAAGESTGGAYGFTTMLFKILDEEQPDLLGVAFDLPTLTFRHALFSDYKATRRETPDELKPQMQMVQDLLSALRLPTYTHEGYEADDIIGTLAAKGEAAGYDVLIVTGDLDELQLVSDRVTVMVTRRGITDTHRYDVAEVEARYGFAPHQLPDFRALRGDTTDNIPGVPGIGEKTAASLIAKYGSLEAVLARAEEVRPARVSAALTTHQTIAARAKVLSTITRDLPLPLEEEQLRIKEPDRPRLLDLFRRLDFRSLAQRFAAAEVEATAPSRLLSTPEEVAQFAAELTRVEEIIVHPIASDEPGLRAKLYGVTLLAAGEPTTVLADGKIAHLLAPLRTVFESPQVRKVGHDLKRLGLLLSQYDIGLAGMHFDTMLASYLSDPGRKHDLASSLYQFLQLEPEPRLALEEAMDPGRFARTVEQIARLRVRLEARLDERAQRGVFAQIEMPLLPVLLAMELTGVAIDAAALGCLSQRLGERVRALETDIHALAGEVFNIASPQQLQRILFDKLKLPPDRSRRTKTGFSTGAEVLARLNEHEIVAKILEYRELTKLKGTYVDALPQLVNPRTGRVHTSFNQAVTATGRLSSSDPNLQNIPIRTELGAESRRAFIPGEPGWRLISADYSQIELRLLAHITQDERLIEVFRQDLDLHRAAAAEIFGVSPDQVTPEMRAFAKMVNFGVTYGMSETRLAREMRIPVEQAREYIARYFDRFPRVRDYVQEIPRRAAVTGYVLTLLGRRRDLPDLRATNLQLRQAAERMAVNTPMQGAAADIMKLAMIELHQELRNQGRSAKLLLQVHDELVLEAPEEEVGPVANLVRNCMSQAHALVVPLKVDLKVGENWLEMAPL